MVNFRFNLDVRFKDNESAQLAKQMIKEGKQIPPELFFPKNTSIYLSVSHLGKYQKVNTGIKIKPINFDTDRQKVKTKDQFSFEKQQLLDTFRQRCYSQYHQFLIRQKSPSISEMKQLLKTAIHLPVKHTDLSFFDYYDLFLDHLRNVKRLQPKTISRYIVLKEVLKQFEENVRTLDINEINERFGQQLTNFLNDTRNLAHNTVVKFLKCLKSFARFCYEEDYSTNKKFLKIRAIEDESSIFVLTEEEINLIYNETELTPSELEVKDIFCFLCFTGQRFSDVKALKWNDIIEKDNELYWKLYQKKTRATTEIYIPILPIAREILAKRKRSNNTLVFNVKSNQKTNYILKRVARKAGIKGEFIMRRKIRGEMTEIIMDRADKISTHAGRKSFITNALNKGLSLAMVKQISGHSDIKSMKPYIKLAENHITEQLIKAFDDKI